jgi:AcrR family transcriptional regulator
VDAAARLLAARPPAAVSVRDIAEEAGVNHGLVHRYFGSKDALVRAALRSRAAASMEQFAGVDDVPELLVRLRRAAADPHSGWRLLAHSLLDGYGEEIAQGDFPWIPRFVDNIAEAQKAGAVRDDLDPTDVARLMLATMLGWLQFHEYIAASTHVEHGDVLDELATTLAIVLRPPPPPTRDGPDGA